MTVMTVTLFDFGAWYPPYGTPIDQKTGTYTKMARGLQKDGWSFRDGAWHYKDSVLTVNPLGFAVLSGDQCPTWEHCHIKHWTKSSAVNTAPYSTTLPDDWADDIALQIAKNAQSILLDWCAHRSISGMAIDCRRLLARCERISLAYPPSQQGEFEKIMTSVRRQVKVLIYASSAEYESNIMAAILHTLSTTLFTASTFLIGLCFGGKISLWIALLVALFAIISNIAEFYFNRTDTASPTLPQTPD